MKRRECRASESIVIALFLFGLTVAAYTDHRPGAGENKKNCVKSEMGDWAETQNNAKEMIQIPLKDTGKNIVWAQMNRNKKLGQWLVYDSWNDLIEDREWDMPYADEYTFENIKAAYEEVDFFGEFELGNLEFYDEYKELFAKLVRNEETFWDKEAGEEFYLRDYIWAGEHYDEYGPDDLYFFDADGDMYPELGVVFYAQKYIFKYDTEEEKIILWHEVGTWGSWIGTRKVEYHGLGKFYEFWQLNEGGEIVNDTFFFADWRESGNLYIVMMPEYVEEEKEATVTDEMKEQGMYMLSDHQWYFRVTEEQYDEITEAYWAAYELALEKKKEVTYTYDELFGEDV